MEKDYIDEDEAEEASTALRGDWLPGPPRGTTPLDENLAVPPGLSANCEAN